MQTMVVITIADAMTTAGTIRTAAVAIALAMTVAMELQTTMTRNA